MKRSPQYRYTVWKSFVILIVFILMCAGIVLGLYPSLITGIIPSGEHIPPQGYYVKGADIYDGQGNKHVFKGVSRPSLEWSSKGDHLSRDDYRLMKEWGFNLVRLPLNQRFWLHDEEYKSLVRRNVQEIKSLGMDVILDLHWSDRGEVNREAAQQRMADDDSLTFWTEVAREYKEDGRVLFELYNEPHDISWQTWQFGGQSGDGFETVGMQDLYDAVRSAGADNIVIVNGLNWAFDLSQAEQYAIQGYNIAYGTHIYDQPGKQTVEEWDSSLTAVRKKYPVIVTEFGNFDCNPGFYTKLLAYAKKHSLSWVGWAWYPGGCGFPALINNWEGAPNALGEVLKKAMDE